MKIIINYKKKKKIESIGIKKEGEKKKWEKIAKKTSKIWKNFEEQAIWAVGGRKCI